MHFTIVIWGLSIHLFSLMKSAFLSSKVLWCLYDKQHNTWLLVDMEFLFSCSTRHLTRELSNRVKHSKRNSISTSAHVLYSIYPLALRRHEREIGFHWLELYALVKIFTILKWKCESLIGWHNHTTIIWPQNNGNAMTHFLGKVPVILRLRFPVFLKMSHNDKKKKNSLR